MKIRIEVDEWHPVFVPNTEWGRVEIDVSVEEAKRIEAAFSEFDDVQQLISSRLPDA